MRGDRLETGAVDRLSPQLAANLLRRLPAAGEAELDRHGPGLPGGQQRTRCRANALDLGRREVARPQADSRAAADLLADGHSTRATPPSSSVPTVVPRSPGALRVTAPSSSSPRPEMRASVRPPADLSRTVASGGLSSDAGTATLSGRSPAWPVRVPASGGGAGVPPSELSDRSAGAAEAGLSSSSSPPQPAAAASASVVRTRVCRRRVRNGRARVERARPRAKYGRTCANKLRA